MSLDGPNAWFDSGEGMSRILGKQGIFALSEGWIEYHFEPPTDRRIHADFRLTRLTVVPEPTTLFLSMAVVLLGMRRNLRRAVAPSGNPVA
jgi:hypothetical protein